MCRIVTDVERPSGHSTPWSERRVRHLRRAVGPVLALITVCACTVLPVLSTGPANAATEASLKAQAAQLEQQISSAQQEIDALGQKYDQDEDQINSLQSQITATQDKINADHQQVATDQAILRKAAVNAYINDGTELSTNPLFSPNQSSAAAQQEYGNVANGDLNSAVANLHIAQADLSVQEGNLGAQKQQEESAANAATNAIATANAQEQTLNGDLGQVKGQLATLVAEAEAEAQAAASDLGSANYNGPPLPYVPGPAGIAVRAAESQLGVPYVWGGDSPATGFDCSGLVMWAWEQAGVDLPHYSGDQYKVTSPVPLSDMEPGDILFYGPDGDTHEAMYVGGGEMIQAPTTGERVEIVPAQTTGSPPFAGVHRVVT